MRLPRARWQFLYLGRFDTTLNDEVLTLTVEFGLDVAAIDEILLNGVRHSFLPTARKRRLETTDRAEMDGLEGLHLARR